MTMVSSMGIRLLTGLLLMVGHGAMGQQLKVMTFNIWHGGRENG